MKILKDSEWTNVKLAVRNLLALVMRQNIDDFEYFQEMLEMYDKRFDKAEINDDQKYKEKVAASARLLLEELGLRPMPANRIAKERNVNQISIWGCEEDPCVGKIHCGKCGKCGHREDDGKHNCEPKFGNA